jgi:regulator of protease activity HflC (stomatin/prohibitin superfamily)
VITSSFKAEKTLTKDTVPVNVDAVLFWRVLDPQKAALDVADYQTAISWAAQTALRYVIGKTMLSDMLDGKESAMNFAKSSMSVLSLGASTSFRSSSRMFLSRLA